MFDKNAEITSKIHRLITSNQLDEAKSLLESSYDLLPNKFQTQVFRGLLAEKAEEWETAKEIYSGLCKKDKIHVSAVQGLVRSLIELKEYSAIDDTLALAKEKGISQQCLLSMKGTIAEKRMDWPQAVYILRMLIDINPDIPQHHARLIRALLACDVKKDKHAHLQEVKELSKRAMEKWPDNAWIKSLHIQMLATTMDTDETLKLFKKDYLANINDEKTIYKYVTWLKNNGDFRTAKQIYMSAIANKTTSIQLICLAKLFEWNVEDAELIFDRLHLLLEPSAQLNYHIQDVILVLLYLGRWEEARNFASKEAYFSFLRGNPEKSTIFKALTVILENFPHPQGPLPPTFENDNVDISIYKNTDTDSILFIFTGLDDALTLPLPVIHRLLERLKTNIVYLRDMRRRFYLKGLASCGSNYSATIEKLRGIAKDLGAPNVYCLGNSGGGYAAIRYGIELGAKSVLSFSGPTNISENFMGKHDGRAMAIMRNLSREYTDEELDLKHILANAPNHPLIHQYYCENFVPDKHHSLNIADFPSVKIHPIRDSGIHASVLVLLERMKFLEILKETFNLTDNS